MKLLVHRDFAYAMILNINIYLEACYISVYSIIRE